MLHIQKKLIYHKILIFAFVSLSMPSGLWNCGLSIAILPLAAGGIVVYNREDGVDGKSDKRDRQAYTAKYRHINLCFIILPSGKSVYHNRRVKIPLLHVFFVCGRVPVAETEEIGVE
jgi:hypothetical protein